MFIHVCPYPSSVLTRLPCWLTCYGSLRFKFRKKNQAGRVTQRQSRRFIVNLFRSHSHFWSGENMGKWFSVEPSSGLVSTGGRAVEVTTKIHNSFCLVLIWLYKALHLVIFDCFLTNRNVHCDLIMWKLTRGRDVRVMSMACPFNS